MIELFELLYPLSGFLMKLADDAEDECGRPVTGLVAGMLCGLAVGALAVSNIEAAYIFLGIFAGTLLSLKIDCMSHIAAAAVFLTVLLLNGFPQIALPTLALCALAAYIDEWGNDNPRVYEKGRFFRLFFEYRFSLKIAIFILVIASLTGVSIFYGFHFLTLLYFLLFEAAYEVTGRFSQNLLGGPGP